MKFTLIELEVSLVVNYSLQALGERAILIALGNEINEHIHQQVVGLLAVLERAELLGVVEYVPAYCSIMVHYEPMVIWQSIRTSHDLQQSPSQRLKQQLAFVIEQHAARPDNFSPHEGRVVEIPVCYGGTYGPDLAEVARYNELSVDEVIRIHSGRTYLVHMLGFAPGFPYLGGMDPAIAMPRKAIPRAAIEAGSVGIAGEQTGIYPIRTPGGWRIIGRTPLKLFHPEYEVPSLIQAGDRIKFIPISHEQFSSIGDLHWT